MQHMLHGIINEQEICLDIRGDISDKKHIFSYKSLTSGALIFIIIGIADKKPMFFTYDINIFFTYFLIHIILIYISRQI